MPQYITFSDRSSFGR